MKLAGFSAVADADSDQDSSIALSDKLFQALSAGFPIEVGHLNPPL
jgi:hypothetical protein